MSGEEEISKATQLEEEKAFPEEVAPSPLSLTGYVSCPVCNATLKAQGKYGHFRSLHPELNYDEYKDKFKPAVAPAPKSKGAPLKPIEVETIESALQYIKDRLQRVHGIGANDDLIISALQDDPTPLRDPNLLHAFIKSMAPKAYDSHITTCVIKPLYINFPNLAQMVDRYLANIQGAPSQYTPYVFPPQTVYQPPQYIVPPVQQQTSTAYPYPTYPPPSFQTQPYSQYQGWTPPSIPAPQYPQPIPSERYIDEKFRTLEDRLIRLIEERVKPKEEKEELVDIEEEIPERDREGNIILDESGKAIVKRVKRRVPASQAFMFAPKVEDVEGKVLEKLKLYRDLFGEKREEKPSITKEDVELIVKKALEEKEGKVTPEQVVEIVTEKIEEKLRKPEESEEVKALKMELAENRRKLEELKETLTLKEREALENRIRSLESEIRRIESLRATEGQWTTERIIGQGIDRLAGVAERKEPLRIIVEKLPEISSMVTGAVPQVAAPQEKRAGLIQVLRERGLTVPS